MLIVPIKNIFFRSITMYFLLFILILFYPVHSHSLTTYTNDDDVLSVAELLPIIAFKSFGLKNISTISHSNVISTFTSTSIDLDANFSFTIDDETYTGQGSWDLAEDANGNFTVNFSGTFSNGEDTLTFLYVTSDSFETTVDDFSKGLQDSSVTASIGSQSLNITRHMEIIDSETSVSTVATSTTILNGNTYETSFNQIEDILSETQSNITQNITQTLNGDVNDTMALDYEVLITYSSIGDITSRINKFDLYTDGVLSHKLRRRSFVNTTAIENGIEEYFNLSISETSGQERNFIFNYSGTNLFSDMSEQALSALSFEELVALSETMDSNDERKKNFGKAVVVGAAGGAMTGWYRSAKLPHPLAKIAVIAKDTVAGALIAGGSWEIGELFIDYMYGETDIEYTVPGTSTSYYILPDGSAVLQLYLSVPTLSQWKQIFFTLLMLSLVLGYTKQNSSKLVAIGENTAINLNKFNSIQINKALYQKTFLWVGFTITISLAVSTAFLEPISMIDISGVLFCAPLIAYILHLLIFYLNNDIDTRTLN